MRPLFVALAVLSASAARAAPPCSNRTYCSAALQAANWIVAVAEPAPNGVGIYWPGDLIGQNRDANYNRTYDLYSGVAGTIVFLLEAYAAAGNASHLAAAAAAGAYLASATDAIIASNSSTGLYHGGAAGMAFALDVLDQRTNGSDPALSKAYAALLAYVQASAVPSGGGESLSPFPGLRWGTAGIGMFLLQQYASAPTSRAPLLALAEAAGTYLVASGTPTPGGGLKWPTGFGGAEMPNYAEGTAGVGYFLATLAHALNATAPSNATGFLAASLQGAEYLLSIANTTGGRCLIEHDSGTPGLYYLAECNGPSGTGRFFLRLHAMTGDAKWRAAALAGAKGVVDLSPVSPGSGSDGGHGAFNWYVHWGALLPPPFWNNVGPCDGSAAAVIFFLTLSGIPGVSDPSQLAFARAVADDLLGRATAVVPGEQLAWVTTEWRTDPSHTTAPQVGYMQGAAGVGSTFLLLDAVVSGVPSPHIALPDDYLAAGIPGYDGDL